MATITIHFSGKVNEPPIANAGTDEIIYLPQDSIVLSGSGYDPDGVVVDYQWTQLLGPPCTIVNPTSPVTSVTGMSLVGNYVFRLVVTDNVGNQSGDNISIIVANTP